MEIVINNTNEYLNYVLSNSNRTIIYRGQASFRYDLISSIGRIEGYSLDVERRFFVEFKKRYYAYTTERPTCDLDVLFMAQHYGIPTRLLDWTYNPLIALYFACESKSEMDGRVYSIPLNHVDELSDRTISIDDILHLDRCKYLEPNYTDIRYINQRSIFLLSNIPYKRFTFANRETMYLIKKDAKRQIIKDLTVLGIDKTFVYPILENVSKDIFKKLNIKMKNKNLS